MYIHHVSSMNKFVMNYISVSFSRSKRHMYFKTMYTQPWNKIWDIIYILHMAEYINILILFQVLIS